MKFIDICAGAGGLSLGLTRAGWSGVGVELDPVAARTHNEFVGPCVQADVTTWHPDEKVDLVIGGVPCQPFSQGGLHGGLEDPRGQLFRHLLRIAVEADAPICAMENVRGMVTKGVVPVVEAAFREHGYHPRAQLLSALDYGTAQARTRLFVVGFRDPKVAERFKFPERSCATPRSMADVLGNVPGVTGFLSDGGVTKMPPRRPIHPLTDPCMTVRAQHGGGGVGVLLFGDERMEGKERVLFSDGKTQPFKEEVTRTDVVGYLRRMTVREAARAQDFPEDMKFSGGLSDGYRQVGNAVPVLLGEAMGKAILEATISDDDHPNNPKNSDPDDAQVERRQEYEDGVRSRFP